MDQELKEKWLAALRSGEYKQGQRYLYRQSKDEYCCLGVLCLVAGLPDEEWRESCLAPFDQGPAESLLDFNTAHRLALMNDNGASFIELANWIETNVS